MDDLATVHDILSDALLTALWASHREESRLALYEHGRTDGLLGWERAALVWLAEHWTSQTINGWTAEVIKRHRRVLIAATS